MLHLLLSWAWWRASSAAAAAAPRAPKPNLVYLLADDLGHGNVGFTSPSWGPREAATPQLDWLASRGVVLDRFYTYKFCSPSRCALQSGRLPVHVNVRNLDPAVHDPRTGLVAGVQINMTTMATMLRKQGYRTVFSGKWDVGGVSWLQLPRQRGYDSSLAYIHHANDYYTYRIGVDSGGVDVCLNAFVDLWRDDRPATEFRHAGVYEEDLFRNHTLHAIATHDPTRGPLFVFHSFHAPHAPLQVPEDTEAHFSAIKYANRRKYAAMVFYLDSIVGDIVKALQSNANMYDNTLILFSSDNGGPVYFPGSANNWPLLGGKYADFEGGVRVPAFASGGLVPSHRRGSRSDAIISIADVMATFVRLGAFGVEGPASDSDLDKLLFDAVAFEAGLPLVDSRDFWYAVAGVTPTPAQHRNELHLSQQALIIGQYKLVVGVQTQNHYQGPRYPNATGLQPMHPALDVLHVFDRDCGEQGCLFDVVGDVTEQHDVGEVYPLIRQRLGERLRELNEGVFDPDRGSQDVQYCVASAKRWGGFYGPVLDVPPPPCDHKDVGEVMVADA